MNIRTRESLTGARALAAQVLEAGGTITEAARAAGVSRPTIYAWMKRSHDFPRHIPETVAAASLARKSETNILARLAFGAIAQILSNDQLPAGVRARVALAVLERGNVDSSTWGVPEPALERDAELPKPPVAALTAEARKLYTFTPPLNTSLTPTLPATQSQTTENNPKNVPSTALDPPGSDVSPEKESLYTAA